MNYINLVLILHGEQVRTLYLHHNITVTFFFSPLFFASPPTYFLYYKFGEALADMAHLLGV